MHRHSGFTLIELMVVLAVLAIFATVAIPGFNNMTERNSVSSQTNAVLGFLQLARSEAATRRLITTVCPAKADLSACEGNDIAINGALIMQNGAVIKVLPKASNDNLHSVGSTTLTFNADGTSSGGGWIVSFADGSTPQKVIDVNIAGRTQHH